jgi:hypothetical protein
MVRFGKQIRGDGFDKVLELSTGTLEDSLACTKRGGTVCVTGDDSQGMDSHVNPMELLPSKTELTIHDGGDEDFMKTRSGAACTADGGRSFKD